MVRAPRTGRPVRFRRGPQPPAGFRDNWDREFNGPPDPRYTRGGYERRRREGTRLPVDFANDGRMLGGAALFASFPAMIGFQLIASDKAVLLRLAGVPLVAVTVVLAAWAFRRLRRPVDPEALAATHREHYENRMFKKLRDRIGWDDDHPGRT